MRRFDKKQNMIKVNLLAEQRYFQSKGLLKEDENLTEVNYEDLKQPKDGKWIDAEDIVKNPENYPNVNDGLVWVHTNRHNANLGSNGGVGLYPAKSNGKRASGTLRDKDKVNVHTNEISLAGPITFETKKKVHYNTKSGSDRTVHAGFSGKVIETNPSSGAVPAAYVPPFNELSNEYKIDMPPYFFPVEDFKKPFKNRQIISADSAYFMMKPDGKWRMSATNPKYKIWSKEEYLAEFEEIADSNAPEGITLRGYLDSVGSEVKPELEVKPEPEVKEPELELDKEINETMKNNNRILTESQKRQITENKEKAILESFASTFNKIKRIDESEINDMTQEEKIKKLEEEVKELKSRLFNLERRINITNGI